MKVLLHIMAVAVLVGILAGCGSGVSETKPLDQVQAEAGKMDSSALQKTIDSYKQAITGKQAEVDKIVAEIKKIQPDIAASAKGIIGGITGSDDAKKVTADLEKIKAEVTKLNASKDEILKSIKALEERMAVYAKALKSK